MGEMFLLFMRSVSPLSIQNMTSVSPVKTGTIYPKPRQTERDVSEILLLQAWIWLIRTVNLVSAL